MILYITTGAPADDLHTELMQAGFDAELVETDMDVGDVVAVDVPDAMTLRRLGDWVDDACGLAWESLEDLARANADGMGQVIGPRDDDEPKPFEFWKFRPTPSHLA